MVGVVGWVEGRMVIGRVQEITESTRECSVIVKVGSVLQEAALFRYGFKATCGEGR